MKARFNKDNMLEVYDISQEEMKNLRKLSLQSLRAGLITKEDMKFCYIGNKKLPNTTARIAAYVYNWLKQHLEIEE